MHYLNEEEGSKLKVQRSSINSKLLDGDNLPSVSSYRMISHGNQGGQKMNIVRAAVVQDSPVVLNRKATFEKGVCILTADLHLGEISRSKYDFDVVGHDSRPDIFRLSAYTYPTRPVVVSSDEDGGHPGEAFGKHDF
jgi:hypothetical protein